MILNIKNVPGHFFDTRVRRTVIFHFELKIGQSDILDSLFGDGKRYLYFAICASSPLIRFAKSLSSKK